MHLETLLQRFHSEKTRLVSPEQALPGRNTPILTGDPWHRVLGVPLLAPMPAGFQYLDVGMGCFWGAERLFWQIDGVYCTAVGYGAGYTPNPTYAEVCSGRTGHAELVRVIFDPARVSLDGLLRAFWTGHDPTQGMRQGNDIGTQYRSGLYASDPAMIARLEASRELYAEVLAEAQWSRSITTEIRHLESAEFYFAEAEHQQYLAANPNGYCGLGGTGVPWSDR
ncbi:MAG: peptide-methionine (S)-S-oxide reductase MsrA [Thioalkalivibrionaceae bacterium]